MDNLKNTTINKFPEIGGTSKVMHKKSKWQFHAFFVWIARK